MEAFSLSKPRDIIDLSKPIIVSMESYVPLVKMGKVSDDGLDWHDVTFMTFDDPSRNNNVYPADDTKRSFKESVFIQENLRNRTLYSELEHPDPEAPLSRFLFIEPTRYACAILSLVDKGDRFCGDITLCSPLGTGIVLPNFKRIGSNYAFSCRIYTPNFVEKEQNGAKIYIKKYRMYPITFDLVTMPGLPKCRIAKDGEYNPGSVDNTLMNKTSTENFNGVVKFSNPANELKKMMQSSESSKILEDYFHADFRKDAILMGNNKVKLSTEDGVSVIVPLNRQLVSSILGK